MNEQVNFIWGAGGVGKSHYAVRRLAQAPEGSLLITLDPSPRIFHLLHIEKAAEVTPFQLAGRPYFIKATDADLLFERLNQAAPANAQVKKYYFQLVQGLQEFRDYLALIQLAEDLSQQNYPCIIVDTPPFHEAVGLHHSISTLREFFEKSVVQLAVRSSFMNMGVRKVIEVSRLFMGKRAVDEALGFLDWLHLHLERFQKAAGILDEMLFSPKTTHSMVLTPETPQNYLSEVKSFFERSSQVRFIMNRSVDHYHVEGKTDSLSHEIQQMQKQQKNLEENIQSSFQDYQFKKIPFVLMGDDSLEELNKFISI